MQPTFLVLIQQPQAAQARVLRAFALFYLLDLYGQYPSGMLAIIYYLPR